MRIFAISLGVVFGVLLLGSVVEISMNNANAEEMDVSLTATNHFIGESVTLFGTVEQIIEYPETLEFSHVSVVDMMGVSLSDILVDQQIQIKSNMTNSQSDDQEFTYIVQIIDESNFVNSLVWLSDSFSPEETLNPTLSWIPSTNGTFDVQVFVWNNLDSPLSLTSSLEFELDVGSSPSFEEITPPSIVVRNLPVLIQVFSPDGDIVYVDEIQSFSDKYFSSLIKLDGDLFQKLGQYEIITSYGTNSISNYFSIIENVVEESIQIPYGAIQIIIPEDSSDCEQDPCFTPSIVSVEPGQPIVWINYDDTVHTVVSGVISNDLTAPFDSGMITPDTYFSHTFYQQGTIEYFCELHPWMDGQVLVEIIPEDISEDIPEDEISCESNEILVDNQCVVENITEQIPATISISTEKSEYLYDDEINVIVDTSYTGEFTIQFIDPNGLKIMSDKTTDLSSKFKARGSLWQNNGTYSIVLLVDDIIKGETTFSMGYAPIGITSTVGSQISSDPDDTPPDDIVAPDDQELILKNPQTVNGFGNKIDVFLPDQSIQITSDIFNYNDYPQSFAYVLKIKDSLGKTTDPKWITGLLNPNQSLTPSLSWTPQVGGMHVIMIEIWNNPSDRTLLSPTVEFSINVDDIVSTSESAPITESIDLGFASFVDETKDAQSYVDRYNNEASYKEWFDENYSEYDSIYQAVGIEEPDVTMPELTYQLEPTCGFGTELKDGICQVKRNTTSETLNSDPTCGVGTKLINDVCIPKDKINISKQSKNFKSSTVTETSCGFGTELKDGICQAKRIISFSFDGFFSNIKNIFNFS